MAAPRPRRRSWTVVSTWKPTQTDPLSTAMTALAGYTESEDQLSCWASRRSCSACHPAVTR